VLIWDATEGFEDGYENLACSFAGDSHADLLAYLLLGALKDECIWEGLKAGAFAVCEGTGFLVMINVGSSPARACDGIGWLRGIEATVELADSGSTDIEKEIGSGLERLGVEDVLPFPDELQTFSDLAVHAHKLMVGSIVRDVWFFDGFLAGLVVRWFWCCWSRRIECERFAVSICLVISDTHNDNPMACLRDAILLELVEMWVDTVASILHVLKDLLESMTVISAGKTADVLAQEPFWLIGFENADAIGIERSILSMEALLLADEGEVIAREAKSKGIEGVGLEKAARLDVDGMDILAEDAIWGAWTNVGTVGLASEWVDVIRPCMMDAEFWMIGNLCQFCSDSNTARSAEEFAEMEGTWIFRRIHKKPSILRVFTKNKGLWVAENLDCLRI